MSNRRPTSKDTPTNPSPDLGDLPVSSLGETLSHKTLTEVFADSQRLPAAQQLALLLADMRLRWANGHCLMAEDYLVGLANGAGEDEETVIDFVYSEYLLREEHGHQVPTEEYDRRFPSFGAALKRQFILHDALQGSIESMAETVIGGDVPTQTDLQRIGKYVIVSKLGQGAHSNVYRAVHPDLGIEVAIKLAPPLSNITAIHRETLREEARMLSELNHPNLARVFDLDFHDNRPFLVLEFIRGPNLLQFVQQGPVSPWQAASLIATVARALFEVHRHGILHLDVKPNNLVIDESGVPRLIDFGLSRRLDAWSEPEPVANQRISGTIPFMSPEQAVGETGKIDQRSDIFSLGATLYFLLVGKPPYSNQELAEVIRCTRCCEWDREALNSPQISKRLREICLKAMEQNPENRYPTASEFAETLDACAAGSRRGWHLGFSIAGIALLMVPLLGWSLGWFSFAVPAKPTTIAMPKQQASPLSLAAAIPPQPKLNVRVLNSEQTFNLSDVVPVENGDKVQVRASVPPGWHATLFLFTSAGELKELARVAPSDNPQMLHFPTNVGQAAPMRGPPGTEFLLVCLDDHQPVSLNMMQAVWGEMPRWPLIPELLVVRIVPEGVVIEQRDRDFGPPSDVQNPETIVIQHLKRLQEKLSHRFLAFEGIAFAHKE